MSWLGGGTTQRDRLFVTVESVDVTLPCWWRRSHTVGLVPCGWEVHLVQVNVPRTRFPSAWLLQQMQGAHTQYADVGIPGGCLDTDMFRGGRQDTLLQLHLPDANLVTKKAGSLIPKLKHWSCTKAGKSYLATDLEGRCWSFPFKRILSGTWNISSIEDWWLAIAVFDCWFPPTCIPYICPPASSTMCGSPLREVAVSDLTFYWSKYYSILSIWDIFLRVCASNILA